MFGFHFRYWAVEIVAEGEEPLNMYEDPEDEDKPSSSSTSKVKSIQRTEDDSQETELNSQQIVID